MGPSVFCWNAKGAIFVDDFSVEKVPDTTALSPLVTDGGKTHNIVKQDGPVATEQEALAAFKVVLRAWNKTLLFDPGTYIYDHSNWRCFTIPGGAILPPGRRILHHPSQRGRLRLQP